MLKRLSVAALRRCCSAFTGTALAQSYPDRPITMIIPFAAGGPTDVLGRVMAQRMSEILGQQVVVENVGGAGGMTGSQARRRCRARRLHLRCSAPSAPTRRARRSTRSRSTTRSTDFTPVALIAEVPIVLTVRKDLPVKNFKEFVAYAKANQAQDAVRLGRRRLGHPSRLRAAQLRASGPTSRMCPIAAPGRRCRTCTAAASISCARSSPPPSRRSTAAPSRRWRSSTRSARRRCRTCRPPLEQGTEKLEAYTWNAIFLPKGAPADVVKKLNEAVVQAMKTPAVRERLAGLGAEIVSGRSRDAAISRPSSSRARSRNGRRRSRRAACRWM